MQFKLNALNTTSPAEYFRVYAEIKVSKRNTHQVKLARIILVEMVQHNVGRHGRG